MKRRIDAQQTRDGITRSARRKELAGIGRSDVERCFQQERIDTASRETAPAGRQRIATMPPAEIMARAQVIKDTWARNHGYLVYEPLFSYDSHLVPKPQGVESWTTSGDGLTWTFTLRPGITFPDGSPITAK